jgi:hypothetical protein
MSPFRQNATAPTQRLGWFKTMPFWLRVAVGLAVMVAEGEDPYSMLATTFHYEATRRITEIGLLVALLGGLLIAVGSSRRAWVGFGGLLIAVGLAAALVALHFGVSPYRHSR